MKRFMQWAAALLILATATSFASAQPVASLKKTDKIPIMKLVGRTASKVGKKLSGVEDLKFLVDIADEATRKESEVIAKAIEHGFIERGRLVSGTAPVDVVVTQTISCWRGSVKQQLTMPCTATLAIDLNKLLVNATYNPATKTIEIYLPPPSIIAVESHNSKYTVNPEYYEGCFDWYDSSTATSLEFSLLKSDWSALARKEIDPNAQHLREAAKNEATRFLRGLLAPIDPKLKIVVRP